MAAKNPDVFRAMTGRPWRVVRNAPTDPTTIVAVVGDGRSTYIVSDSHDRGMPHEDAEGIVAAVNSVTPLLVGELSQREAAAVLTERQRNVLITLLARRDYLKDVETFSTIRQLIARAHGEDVATQIEDAAHKRVEHNRIATVD